jgi:hypothetical protein
MAGFQKEGEGKSEPHNPVPVHRPQSSDSKIPCPGNGEPPLPHPAASRQWQKQLEVDSAPKIELSKIAFWSEREQLGVPLMGTAGASEVAGGYGRDDASRRSRH